MKVKAVTTYHIELDDEESANMQAFIRNVLHSNFGSHRSHDLDHTAAQLQAALEACTPSQPPF